MVLPKELAQEGHPVSRVAQRVPGHGTHQKRPRHSGPQTVQQAAASRPGEWQIKVKMLPFDNKSEFQVILNMPEGSALERTAQAAREIAAAVRSEPEVTDYQIYAGVLSARLSTSLIARSS